MVKSYISKVNKVYKGLKAKCRTIPNCHLTTKVGAVHGREVRVKTDDPSLKTRQETKFSP